LQAFRAGAGSLYACERCGGQLVTHGLLRALIEQRETLGSAAASSADAPRGNPLKEPVRYRPCPACGQMMNRKNFGGTSGIIVDLCTSHGTYFDAGELPRVLEFVRRGGLAKARAVLQNRPPQALPGGLLEGTHAAPPQGLLDDLVDLVDFVVHVLRDK
jgi:Zn-finger nucleic acid-binding protein